MFLIILIGIRFLINTLKYSEKLYKEFIYIHNLNLKFKKNYEVVFCDNQSTDKSKLIFLDINDNRFKYFSDNEHVTLYGARNKALKVTNGKYIAFLDVDDMWYPDKLEKQVKVMEKNSEIGFCYSGFKFLSENGKKLKSAYNYKKLKS